jgi:hypothetical protein
MASLPNPIGGNQEAGQTPLATLQAEAREETREKVRITTSDRLFYIDGVYNFHVSTAYIYNPNAALSGLQRMAITAADNNWRNEYPGNCGGCGNRRNCNYCHYLFNYKEGLTLLENTGEVATLDLMLVNTTSAHTAAQSIHNSVQGIAALAAITAVFTGSHTVLAIRKLSAWVKYKQKVNSIKAQIVLALAYAVPRHAAPHAPVANPQMATFNDAKAQIQINATYINAANLASAPDSATEVADIMADDADITACQNLLTNYRAGAALGVPPGVRPSRDVFTTQVITLITQLARAEAQLV